jgi:hypothetical protein
MNCTFDKDLVQEYAIGEVTAYERREVEDHLGRCAHCRMEVAAFRQLARQLSDLPEPDFPDGLEETLIRASIQAARSTAPALEARSPIRLRPAWALGLASLAGTAVLVLLVVLLWPGRLSSWMPVNRVVGSGVGQGLGLLDGILRWVGDLRSGWSLLKEFVSYLSPVRRAASIALSGVAGPVWAALILGAVGGTLVLWRVTGGGQKKMRRAGHARPQV